MSLGHEKLDVYRLSIDYVAWVFAQSVELTGIHRHARDQWLRASQSIPLNIAEGNGKTAEADRRRYFEIAHESALECAAVQGVLRVGNALEENEHQDRKKHLDRIAAMLSRLGGREDTPFGKMRQFMTPNRAISIPIAISISIMGNPNKTWDSMPGSASCLARGLQVCAGFQAATSPL